MNYVVRKLVESDFESANYLYSKVYNKERSNKDFIWEFVDGPAGRAIYVGAFDGEKLIGTQAAIPLYFINERGERVLTAKSEDTLLDPEYRGKGLFDQMYKLLFDECQKIGIVSIWGFTYAKKPFLKLGFEIPFETNNAIFVFNPVESYKYLSRLNLQNKLREKFMIAVFVFVSYLKQAFYIKKRFDLNIKFKNVSSNVSLLNNILKREECQTLNQDEKYFDWRIKLNPYGNDYKECCLEDEQSKKVASIIFNIRSDGFAYIEQMLFDRLLPESAKQSMISNLLSYLKKRKVFLIRFWGMECNHINTEEIGLLKKCGFVFSGKGTAFVYRKIAPDLCVNPSNILISRLFTQGNV